ncbi:MAG: CRISPR-associated endonuclease Cas2 [Candidatus Eisenbacteria bacterium]|nr:CRISPR-associated endonuclease Cas2 [Candidatus Eisenbacteria bacterium]
MSLYLAAYDIAADRRRRSVARTLRGYGQRIQESVFEVWLDPGEVAELRLRVAADLEVEDSFELVPIDERGARRRFRWQREIEPWDPVLFR